MINVIYYYAMYPVLTHVAYKLFSSLCTWMDTCFNCLVYTVLMPNQRIFIDHTVERHFYIATLLMFTIVYYCENDL